MEDKVIYGVKTPCYVINKKKLKENLECLKYVKDRSGCGILLAQKARQDAGSHRFPDHGLP